MSSQGGRPPPSSPFRNSYSPLPQSGHTNSISHPSGAFWQQSPAVPWPHLETAQHQIQQISSNVRNGRFPDPQSDGLRQLHQLITQLVVNWNDKYANLPIALSTRAPAPDEGMAAEPTSAPTSGPSNPAPASTPGPVPSYAAAAASVASSQHPSAPQPQGKKAPAPSTAGKSKKTSAAKAAASVDPLPIPSRPDPLARVAALAAAFPKAPATQLIQVARDMGPLYPTPPPGPERPAGPPKPKVKHAPTGAMNTITVAISGTTPPPSSIPNDGALRQMFQDWLTSHPLPASDADGLTVEFVRWMPTTSFRVRFNKRPPPSLDNTFREFVLHYFTDSRTATATAARFQFRNTIFFRRIPLQARDGTPVTVDTLLQDLRKDPRWANVNILSPPRIHTPKSARGFGVLYVDFADNARGSVLRDVLRRSVILHGESCWAQAARSAKNYTVPRCTTCQKWGHRANHCRSIYRRCAHCSGLHDERDHTSKAPCCSGTGNVTCPHPPTCTNCRGAHRADSKECGFYKHRQDYPWIKAHQPGPQKPKSGKTNAMPTSQDKGKGRAGPSADDAMVEI